MTRVISMLLFEQKKMFVPINGANKLPKNANFYFCQMLLVFYIQIVMSSNNQKLKMILKCVIPPEMVKKSVVDGGFAVVSLQFYIVHTYNSHHTKEDP